MVEAANDEIEAVRVLETKRLRVSLQGTVQGVGFRPFVFRLAGELGLTGWVGNTSAGVDIEVEGVAPALTSFLLRLSAEKPPHCFFLSLESSWLDPAGYQGFAIKASQAGEKRALVLPDIGTCPDCLHEIRDPINRRYRYPFTNCTQCGPRFSIIEALPYDRGNTTMKGFAMCPQCATEYENPENRRFHAQPNACPVCGPQLELWDGTGVVLARQDESLMAAAQAIRSGKILALKGLGGFQLLVDARQPEPVRQLRNRKHREAKPLALMFPTLASIQAVCEVSDLEARLLTSSESPIVLLRRQPQAADAGSNAPGFAAMELIAPGNPCLGVMLPYTPLHHLLMEELGFPVVATSGNLSEEPICLDEQEALDRLRGIADLFLVHNRPIARQVDDSVARVILGREQVLRRARGYAPLPVRSPKPLTGCLAVGAHLKNTIAASVDQNIFVSQHIGDLETPQANAAFEKVIQDFSRLYELEPKTVACDLHPDYRSTQYARRGKLPVAAVQHHFAHLRSCMAENELAPPVLGVTWDGTGYGTDGTIWGGEFLLALKDSFVRVACLRPFRLPGGEQGVREPRRAALGLLYEIFGDRAFGLRELAPIQSLQAGEAEIFQAMLARKVQAPVTTSAGRLFDAVAALAGGRSHAQFEGQAAMEWEFAAEGYPTANSYALRLDRQPVPPEGQTGAEKQLGIPLPQTGLVLIDWEPMVWGLLEDMRCRVATGLMAAKFHNTLTEAVVAVARLLGEERVALTGGCFQNRRLTERTVRRLSEEGFRPYWHQRIPPNDGGIALGQIAAAARERLGN